MPFKSFALASSQPRTPSQRWVRRGLAALAALSCSLAVVPAVVAQELPGFTLFGGPRRESQLSFRLDRGRESSWDRYRLRIPAQNLAIAQIAIDYPDYYKGRFDTDRIDVRYKNGGEKIELDRVVWNPENYTIEIYPKEPIPSGKQLEVVLSNVRNPDMGGMYYFNCRILTPGDTPLLRYIGTWLIQIT
ncbi:MAG: DUF2808 domain-containing protein [Limnothrix sp. CACIAM 69d]|jgi:hypothetical protein|nr:MAG: DUF2808 domain-containing protein [Limnothrix sp. CACIAM 69d]